MSIFNSQSWTFTILPQKKAVQTFAERVASFFEKLNTTAEKTLLRMLLKHAVIALGYPDEVYQRITGRKKVTPRYFEG